MNDERLLPLLEQYARSRDTALRDQLVEEEHFAISLGTATL